MDQVQRRFIDGVTAARSDVAAVMADLGSTPGGLSHDEATQRLAAIGPNALRDVAQRTAVQLLRAQFANVLLWLLLVAIALSIWMDHAVEAAAIGVIALLSVVLGFAQEYRAERSLAALRDLSAPHAVVIRDGVAEDRPARDVVPGDIIVLAEGQRVPADARLIESVALAAQEAVLTGESVPVEKDSGPLRGSGETPGDRHTMVHAGTVITRGRGRAIVVATGMESEIGRVATLLATVEDAPTPLQRTLDRVGRWLALAAVVVILVIVGAGLLRGQPIGELLIFAIALAVAVVPEALPAVVTIALALGVQRLIARRALMRRLPAVETLGSTTVICTDKTGTLTRNEMAVRRVRVAGRSLDLAAVDVETMAGAGAQSVFAAPIDASTADVARQLLVAGAIASDAPVPRRTDDGRWATIGDPMEAALQVAARTVGWTDATAHALGPRVAELPFAAATRLMAVAHANGPDGLFIRAKGAPEAVVARCTMHRLLHGDEPLTTAGRASWMADAEAMADDGLRVLAIAERRGPPDTPLDESLTLLGLIGLFDPPRAEAREAIARCRAAGIRVLMVTGDHPRTAIAIARDVGLADGEEPLLGAELQRIDDASLLDALRRHPVVARVAPDQKLRIVTVLQADGEIVAMTGDGVNDAPALKQADIGVAMGVSGTDVAREAAAMTLTDDNFASIVAAIEEGRTIYANIRKFLAFLLSSNVGEILLMAGAAVLGYPVPLSAVQLLYVNLATDGLPALALAVDPPSPGAMAQPPRDPRAGLLTRPLLILIVVGGFWSACVNLGLFAWDLARGTDLRGAMTMTFVSLVVLQFFKAYTFRSEWLPAWRGILRNRWLALAVAWELLLLCLIVFVEPLHAPFGTRSLTAGELLLTVVAASTIVPVLELAKRLVRR